MNRLTVILMIGVVAVLCACANEKDVPEVQDAPLSAPLQMNDLNEGTGDPAQTGDTVLVHYTGWLYSNGTRGEQFDTSRDRGLFEVTIGETRVMQGWTKGLVGMKVGGVRQLIIPPELAFGAEGRPPQIPPSSTLEFEIELHGIVKPNKQP